MRMPQMRLMFFFYGDGDHRDLHVLTHSFPTRRSSDLTQQALAARGLADLRAAESRAKEAVARLSARLEALEAERTTHERRVRDMENAAVALAADRRREASLAEDARSALDRLEAEKAALSTRLEQARGSTDSLAARVGEAEQIGRAHV